MRALRISLNLAVRRFVCRIFSHARANVSLRTVGIVLCSRCLRIVEQKTVRARVTRGEIEQRMAANPPEGYSFLSVNWKKRKAKFVSPNARLVFVNF